jgi:dTDP-4-dehydrorhamnose reductase
MSTKVLVTGANGQLGKTLVELYSNNTNNIIFTFTTKLELDIAGRCNVDLFFSNNNFDYCINCAACTNVEQAETTPEPAFKVNAKAVKILALACKKTNTTLIHISTDYVFDGAKNIPYTEDDQTNPINEYGKSKLLGEKYIQESFDKYFIIRTSWLYSTYGNNFLKTMVKKINRDEKLKITTSQKGTPTSCEDLSKFIIHLISSNQNKFGIYNLSAQGDTTWHGFAVQISKHFTKYNKSYISPVKEFFSRAKRPKYSVLDNSKSQHVYSKTVDWKISVDNTVKNLINTQ